MGITGLLPLLKGSMEEVHISQFKGKRLAVDAYCWLHRAVYGVSHELVKNLDSSVWIRYCMSMLDMLLSSGVEVYLVFDGKNLPAKEKTEKEREKTRKRNLELGEQEQRKGNSAEARSLLARAVDVTPRMAAQFIRVVNRHRPQVKSVVAPYEADAQLSYLCSSNIVDGVISEDSDCIPYACKSIIFKLDRQSGRCNHLNLSALKRHDNKSFNLTQFDQSMMITMCVAAGCDYAPSPKNFGIKTSHRLVSKLKTPNRLLKSMKFDGIMPLVVCHKTSTADSLVYEYELDFYKAFMTFHHQTIFDPVARRMKSLQPFDISKHNAMYPSYLHIRDSQSSSTLFPFLGHIVEDNHLSAAIADGLVDPATHEAFDIPETIENLNNLNRRHTMGTTISRSESDGSVNQKTNKRNTSDVKSSVTDPPSNKRRRSTGTQGVFVNEAVSGAKLRMNANGSLSSLSRQAPKITTFFPSGPVQLPEKLPNKPVSKAAHALAKLQNAKTNADAAQKRTTSRHFQSPSKSVSVNESLRRLKESACKQASERIQSSSSAEAEEASQSQGRNCSSQDTCTTVSTSSSAYEDSLTPPIRLPCRTVTSSTTGFESIDFDKFGYSSSKNNMRVEINLLESDEFSNQSDCSVEIMATGHSSSCLSQKGKQQMNEQKENLFSVFKFNADKSKDKAL